MENKCQHPKITQRNKFLKLLQRFEKLFDGTLGTWNTYPAEFKLKENAKPICSRPYQVPKVNE